MYNQLIKFNFPTLPLFNITFLYILTFDLFLLFIYFSIFQFNKISFVSTEHTLDNNKSIPQHLNLSNCLSIIILDSNNHIICDGNSLDLVQFYSYIKKWNPRKDSFVIIYCYKDSDINQLFQIINAFGSLNIQRVFITSNVK